MENDKNVQPWTAIQHYTFCIVCLCLTAALVFSPGCTFRLGDSVEISISRINQAPDEDIYRSLPEKSTLPK